MFNTKNVFIVDDDLFFSQMLIDKLSKPTSYQLKSFATGEECLDNLLTDKPAIIILDYTLNDVNPSAANGIKILDEIKRILPSTHVIMLSGQSKYEVAMQTLTKGAEYYIIKDSDTFKKIAAILKTYFN
jgi:DNA-binding NarL/FixJ family response regulator